MFLIPTLVVELIAVFIFHLLGQIRCSAHTVETARLWLCYLDRDFDNAVGALAEQLVSLDDALQREAMGEQRPEVDLAMRYQLHQPAHALLAAGTERSHD